MKSTITVSEIFGPTIQGEGALIGRPTLFVRTGGCDFRCSWCDSMHAVDKAKHGHQWRELSVGEIINELCLLSNGRPLWVTLSGGNPAMQIHLGELIDAGRQLGFSFAMETQGTITRQWFGHLDHLILSPKGPSSGMPFSMFKLATCFTAGPGPYATSLKFVIFNDDDYNFARDVAAQFASDVNPHVPVYLSVGTVPIADLDIKFEGETDAVLYVESMARAEQLRRQILERTRWLIDKVNADQWFSLAGILPQLHVLLWGDKLGV